LERLGVIAARERLLGGTRQSRILNIRSPAELLRLSLLFLILFLIRRLC
jgi:hypothetical protein